MPGQTLPDIRHLRLWIGREEVASDVISVDLIRKFNAVLDLSTDEPPLGAPAPLLIHYCLAQPVAPTVLLGEDGHVQRGGFLPPVPLPRRMWAGSRIIFHGDLFSGDEIRRIARIADVAFREGRSGALCFVTVEHRIEVAGLLKIEESQTIVYREAVTGQDAGKPAGPAPVGRNSRPISLSTPLLFRYSALTFNAHRIHYDRAYATCIEHYPGLVVHGPLQATLLLNYATELNGKAPARFTFRGLSPLFDDDDVSLHATADDAGMKLWTACNGGPVAMSAEASWS